MRIMDLNGERSVGDSSVIIHGVIGVAGRLRSFITLYHVRKAVLTIHRISFSYVVRAIPKCMPKLEIISMASVYHGICKHCGNGFEQRGPGRRRKFCCEECQRVWWKEHRDQRKHYSFVCKNCGQEYQTTDVRRNTVCSEDCRQEWIGKQRHQGALTEKQCLSCGETFEGIPSGLDYCSDECKERGVPRTCKVCDGEFYGRQNTCYCSDECRLKYHRRYYEEYMLEKVGDRSYTCQECGKEFIAPYGDKRREFCSSECRRRYHGRIHKRTRRALKKSNGPVMRINPLDIYERDGWACGICGKQVDPDLQYPHPMSASLDHVIPLARGGTHTFKNVQLAHLGCNQNKRDIGGAQLRLGLRGGIDYART